MPQRFYLDEQNLTEQFNKLDSNLYDMLEFAYLHEDMVSTIENLMSNWAKNNLKSFQSIEKEWNQLSDKDKEFYEDVDEFAISDFGRWWSELDDLSDEEIKLLILRYRLTISNCLFSDTYDEDSILENIESDWQHEV